MLKPSTCIDDGHGRQLTQTAEGWSFQQASNLSCTWTGCMCALTLNCPLAASTPALSPELALSLVQTWSATLEAVLRQAALAKEPPAAKRQHTDAAKSSGPMHTSAGPKLLPGQRDFQPPDLLVCPLPFGPPVPQQCAC